jgi:hypothetical protein
MRTQRRCGGSNRFTVGVLEYDLNADPTLSDGLRSYLEGSQMSGNSSVFQYEIVGDKERADEMAEKIDEQLNRGTTYVISPTERKLVSLAGEWKGWVSTEVHANRIHILVDDRYFTASCVPEQILASLWADLLDFGELRLEEFELSDGLHSRLASHLNRTTVAELLGESGPYFGTIFKTIFGISLEEKVNIAEKFAKMGGAFIKEDEIYLVERSKILEESKRVQRAMSEVSEHCLYVPNVTPYFSDESFLQELYRVGIRLVMVDYWIAGLPAVYRAVRTHSNLLFWGHRIGYKSVQRYMSMRSMACLAAYGGISAIHIGTPFVSARNAVEESVCILQAVQKVNPRATPIFSDVSPEIVSYLVKVFGRNIINMAVGSTRTNGLLDWQKTRELIDKLAAERLE